MKGATRQNQMVDFPRGIIGVMKKTKIIGLALMLVAMAMGWFLFFLLHFNPSADQFDKYQLVYRAWNNIPFRMTLFIVAFMTFIMGTIFFEE